MTPQELRVYNAAFAWWASKRPPGLTTVQHAKQNPLAGCSGAAMCNLATAIANKVLADVAAKKKK